ncbi:hypothetical protein LTR36_010389 [Oleoguttula mirabilis]|uniref:DNA-directed RNA polymerase subunit n=1 Tax=Oleoguttula mirabilis TaxID=1507867 RepID=A0AAV9J4W2_9PEZI|nr:hypothetical protein LTR36_010389 [Oleoguttula mirabilis]
MSTEPASTRIPEMVKKKKAKAEGSLNKRKREDEDRAPDTTAPAVKKTKKTKSKHTGNPADGGDDGVPPASTHVPKDQTVTEKRKVTEDQVAESPAPAKKTKKPKKPKVPKELAGESPVASLVAAKKQKTKTNGRAGPTAVADPDELLRSESPFVQQTSSFYLALSPCAHEYPLEGLCAEHISPLLLSYYPPLKGIVLSYDNPRLSEDPEDQQTQAGSSREAKTVLARSIDEYAVTYVWLTAEFLIFKPNNGTYLEGYVNLQNESILGLVCYNYFNAGIERHRLPKDWRWVGDDNAFEGRGKQSASQGGEGYWADGAGKKVEGRVVFRVRDFEATPGSESGAGSINIYGTLLSDAEDEALDDEERQRGLVGDRSR